MNERDERAFGAVARLVVDEFDAARLELSQRGANVVDAQRDVMKAGAALLDESGDRRPGRGRQEQFQAHSGAPVTRLADRHEMRLHLLARHVLGRFDLESERVAIKPQGGVEIFHRDADVIENGLHQSPSARVRPSASNSSAAVYGSISRATTRSTIASSSPGLKTPRSR